jgi:hypothetical protein
MQEEIAYRVGSRTLHTSFCIITPRAFGARKGYNVVFTNRVAKSCTSAIMKLLAKKLQAPKH